VKRTEGSKRKAATTAGQDVSKQQPKAAPAAKPGASASKKQPAARKPGSGNSTAPAKPKGQAPQPRRKGGAPGGTATPAKAASTTSKQESKHVRPHKAQKPKAALQAAAPNKGSATNGGDKDSSKGSGSRKQDSQTASNSGGGGQGTSQSKNQQDGNSDSSSTDADSSSRADNSSAGGDGNPGGSSQAGGDSSSSAGFDSGGGGAAQQQQQSSEVDAETRTTMAMMSIKVEKKARPQRKRKTDAKFLVLPAHKCQLLDDPLANACMYGGLEEARQPDCLEATKGQASNSYLPAFTRIAPYIAQYGPRKYSVGPVWDGGSDETQGEWQSKVDNADVLIMDELAVTYLGDKIAGKKVIALQHDAAASMRTCDAGACASSLLKEDRLLGYLQHTSLVPLTRNNAPRVHDVVHFDLLDHVHRRGKAADAHSGEPTSADQPFSPAMLAKVHTIVPLIWRWRFPITCQGRPEFTEWMMKVLQGGVGDFPPSLRPLHERSVDLTFIGRLQPEESQQEGEEGANELFKLHRQQLFDSVRQLEKDAPEIRVALSEPVEYEAFAQGLRDTKMFISPLGKAESSGKDYEAIISRALLIKPLASMLASYPDIYEVGVTCVEVKADYSDLEAVVKGLLGDTDRMQRIADTAFQRLLSHASERPVAQDVAEVLMDIVERDDPSAIVYLD
jgi:hypothetical protein